MLLPSILNATVHDLGMTPPYAGMVTLMLASLFLFSAAVRARNKRK